MADGIRDFPFVNPPPSFTDSAVVSCEPGTRHWIERSEMSNLRLWIEEVQCWLKGDTIPLQWVPNFVGVSRTAVKKRVDSGKLTVLSFVPMKERTTILGRELYREGRGSFDYAIISECEAWRDLLNLKAGTYSPSDVLESWEEDGYKTISNTTYKNRRDRVTYRYRP